MKKPIKAKFSKGMIEPLEKIDIEEGKEIAVTIAEIPGKETEDPFDTTFGGSADSIDCEKLKRNIYNDRLISTTVEP